jgi:transposase-like protein
MKAYREAAREFRLEYFLRAAKDAGGNVCAAARNAGVHRNLAWRTLHAAGYGSRLLKQLAKIEATKKPPKPEIVACYRQSFANRKSA